MDIKTISKRIIEVKDEVARLQNILSSLEMTNIPRYPETYEELSTAAAMRSEKIACRLRHLIYSTTNIKKSVLMGKVAEAHGIEIEHKDGIFKLTLPALLPKRKYRNMEFFYDPLYFALEKYTNDTWIERYRECVVCFAHIYDRTTPQRQIRDYDNIEWKLILDTIAVFVMTDDGGLMCDMYNTTALGDHDCTCVWVMAKELFPHWLSEHKNVGNTVSDS